MEVDVEVDMVVGMTAVARSECGPSQFVQYVGTDVLAAAVGTDVLAPVGMDVLAAVGNGSQQ
jgi:hypothetical protein